jgi:predicted GIY-YIG superfamily endonuclease
MRVDESTEDGRRTTVDGQRQGQSRCLRLFPDPRPLVERLGRDFFRQLPESPGVYLMHDAAGLVLYVGKAKNLRKRLNSYRVANSDRMARRHLRLLRAVARIELQVCADEQAALMKEAELLRSLRPKFNRAGTWPAPPRFFAWRCCDDQMHVTVADAPPADWLVCGPLGRRASILRGAVARLLWVAAFPELGFTGLPIGWYHGVFAPEIIVPCGPLIGPAALKLEGLLNGESAEFCDWVRTQMPGALNRFDQIALDAEFENLIELVTPNRPADIKIKLAVISPF